MKLPSGFESRHATEIQIQRIIMSMRVFSHYFSVNSPDIRKNAAQDEFVFVDGRRVFVEILFSVNDVCDL
jgi:hypothetical protein